MDGSPQKLKLMWDGAAGGNVTTLLLEFCPAEESVLN